MSSRRIEIRCKTSADLAAFTALANTLKRLCTEVRDLRMLGMTGMLTCSATDEQLAYAMGRSESAALSSLPTTVTDL